MFEFADDELRPAAGIPVPDSDAVGTRSPDGTLASDAELGYVADLAVDDEGRLLLLEQAGPAGADTGYVVRRVEGDGSLATVAGKSNPDADGSLAEDEEMAAFFPADGTGAASLLIYDLTMLAAGPGGQIVLQTPRSVLAVDGDTVRTVLGTAGSGTLPPAADDGPFGAAVDPLSIDYQPGLPQLTLAVNAAGGLLASTDPVSGYDEDAYRWRVEDSTEAAQAIADAQAGDTTTNHPTIYVSADGESMTASVIGGPATWLDDDTLAVTAAGPDGSIIVAIDLRRRR